LIIINKKLAEFSMSKPKTLCKLKKADIEEQFKTLASYTRSSCYLCKKCARSANAKKWLCKPEM